MKTNIGNKAKNLMILGEAGFIVPQIFVLSATDIIKLQSNFDTEIITILKNINDNFSFEKYAVRSSSLLEDLESSSQAGQFHSIINISSNQIQTAIQEVIQDALSKNTDLSQLALIIQEYIPAEISGVTFTRSPTGGREMLIEYHRGEGEMLVSGKIIPEKIISTWNENKTITVFGNNSSDFIETFKKIEQLFQSPMDIEWCIKNGKLTILQARRITSIADSQYQSIVFLEDTLSQINGNYRFETNEVSEICPRPVTFSSSLLREIYKKNGLIDNFYTKHGVTLQNIDFLKIIGNNLYIDKERELQNFFPAFSYFKKNNSKASFASLTGLFPTIKNFIALSFLHIDSYKIEQQLIEKMSSKFSGNSIENFLADYELIYTINLNSGKALKKLEKAVVKTKMSFSDTMSLSGFFEKTAQALSYDDYVGNSLDISDESIFNTHIEQTKNTFPSTQEKWDSLPEWQKKFLTPYIEKAQKADYMRELGRILTVKHMTHIRNDLLSQGAKLGLTHSRDMYFASIDEVLTQNIDTELLSERKKEYQNYNYYSFGTRIRSHYLEENDTALQGVSSGTASGQIVTIDSIDMSQTNQILLVPLLTPNLTQYFDNISGIISETGGILSHLAIMARENSIPVISGWNPSIIDISSGDSVKIDGECGTIEKN